LAKAPVKYGPRALAIRTIWSWLKTDRASRPPLEWMAEETLAKATQLSSRDRAFYREIVSGTIRFLNLLDWCMERYAKRDRRPDPLLRSAILVGAYQILFLERVPGHAAVFETVEGLKRLNPRAAKGAGFVNAVLRRILQEEAVLQKDLIPGLPLSLKYAHPEWMVSRWLERLGRERTRALLAANNVRPSLVLRVNSFRMERDALINLLEREGLEARSGQWSPQAVTFGRPIGDPRRLPGFKDGYFQVQDQGAQLIGFLLDPRPGERILDACAGTGGKTSHIVELSEGRAEVFACERDHGRRRLFRENLRRLDMTSRVKMLEEGDCLRAFPPYNKPMFHKVLVDAPCSGLGVIRRHPDIKWNRREQDIVELSKMQQRLLSGLEGLVLPGGLLVYATCTLEPEETTGVLDRFLGTHPCWELVKDHARLPAPSRRFLDQRGCLQTLGLDIDGFFCAVMKKQPG